MTPSPPRSRIFRDVEDRRVLVSKELLKEHAPPWIAAFSPLLLKLGVRVFRNRNRLKSIWRHGVLPYVYGREKPYGKSTVYTDPMSRTCPRCEDRVQPIAHRRDTEDGPVWFLLCPMECAYVFERITEDDWDDEDEPEDHDSDGGHFTP